jgi:hypothetical protein
MRQPAGSSRPASAAFRDISSISTLAMPLILDTFNVLHTTGVLPPDLAGLDVEGLAVLIARSRYRDERVTFVCDGQPPDTTSRTVPPTDLPPPGPLVVADSNDDTRADRFSVRYSGRAASADDLIRDMVRASTAPRRIIVVSSDHAVQREARKRKCQVLSAEEFLQHLAHDARLAERAGLRAPARPMDSSMSAQQVERWERVFNVDTAALEAEANRRMQTRDQAMPATSSAPAASPANLRAPASAGADASLTGMQPPASERSDAAPPPLPNDLIAQAEALWKREQARSPRLSKNAPSPPAAAGSSTPPARSGSSCKQPAPAVAPRQSADNDDVASHLADLDMNAILPADDQTQPLRPRTERHRPPPPSSTPKP